MNDIVIKVENLTKVYKLYNKPIDRLKESLHPFRKCYHKDFYALNNVTFEIKKGEVVGIIGKNGSGKSTLLKILTGVTTPTSGVVHVNGKISALLELGTGFNPEFTGIENIYFHGLLMGYTKKEMDKKVSEIFSFADIGDFIYQPVKKYSSGMFVRLAFAVAINVDPDILIIDEVLAVGDIRFQQKCYRKFNEFITKGKTILFVSHDVGLINSLCRRCIWFDNGTIKDIGSPNDVTKKFLSFMYYGMENTNNNAENNKEENHLKNKKTPNKNFKWISTDNFESFGTGKVIIKNVALTDEFNNNVEILKGGETLFLYYELLVKEDVENPIIGFIIKDKKGNAVTSSNSFIYREHSKIREFQKGEHIVKATFTLPFLGNGEYLISPAVAEGTQLLHIQHHWVHDAILIKIDSNEEDQKLGVTFCLKKTIFEEILY